MEGGLSFEDTVGVSRLKGGGGYEMAVPPGCEFPTPQPSSARRQGSLRARLVLLMTSSQLPLSRSPRPLTARYRHPAKPTARPKGLSAILEAAQPLWPITVSLGCRAEEEGRGVHGEGAMMGRRARARLKSRDWRGMETDGSAFG